MSARFLPPALATRVDAVPIGGDWLHEPKLDGYRIQCHISRAETMLYSRGGHDWTSRFPALVHESRALAAKRTMVLDGEIVAENDAARPSFRALQQALQRSTTDRVAFWGFDLLTFDGMDLRPLPLTERRSALEAVLQGRDAAGLLRVTPELPGGASTLLAAMCAAGGEGVMSKRRAAPYPSGRSREWLKVKCARQDEFVVIGYSAPRGSREHLGALLLASRPGHAQPMRYAGRVGTGFDADALRDLQQRFTRRHDGPQEVRNVPRATAGVQWVVPSIVVSVTYAEWPEDGLLRHAVFNGVREDKPVKAIVREVVTAESQPEVTHPERVVFPETGSRKMDIAAYYHAAAPLMLPHIANRPLSLLRCPQGAHHQCFFQKHWPAQGGTNIPTAPVNEDDGSTDAYAVVSTADHLVALAQQNVIEIHAWGSRIQALESPDRMVLDLDPGPGVPWSEVCDSAREIRLLLATGGLTSWLKLTGGKGLHLTIPLSGPTSWEQVTMLARLIAERLARQFPKRFTSTMAKRARTGRIFLDWMRNSRGATAVAPWSLRARQGAPIAVPILWDELEGIPRGDLMTMADVLGYLASKPGDPWRDLLASRQKLTQVMVATLGRDAPPH